MFVGMSRQTNPLSDVKNNEEQLSGSLEAAQKTPSANKLKSTRNIKNSTESIDRDLSNKPKGIKQ